jgi:thioredoxin 1
MSTNTIPMITDQTFEAEVLSAPEPVLVDFTATWCSPCRALLPILHKLSVEGAGRLKVVKVDSDASPGLATRFGVRALPTVIAFAGGKEVARHAGLTTREKLLKMIGGEGAEVACDSRAAR